MPKSKEKRHTLVVDNSERSSKEKPLYPAIAPSSIAQHCHEPGPYNQPLSFESKQLYVSNLPKGTNMNEICQIFPECVGIALGVNDDKETHAAYLEFNDAEAANRAFLRGKTASIRGNLLIISPKIGP